MTSDSTYEESYFAVFMMTIITHIITTFKYPCREVKNIEKYSHLTY